MKHHHTTVAVAREPLRFADDHVDLLNGHSELAVAQVLHWAGQSVAALERVERAISLGYQLGSSEIRYQALLFKAWICAESGRTGDGHQALAVALRLGREQGYARLRFYLNNEHILARLCAWALDLGIEVEYTRAVIRERRVVPPFAAPAPEAWPLPIKIYTLGRFALLLDDKPLRFVGKAKLKPLELLKALIAFGGRDVRKDKLAEALWPEADADQATYSLTSTLHRLRAIIGPHAVECQAGRLSLSASHCWVDAWSFERLLTALDHAHRVQHLAETVRLTASLVEHCRGAFLEGDAERPWVLATRERLQRRVLQLLEAVACAHTRAGRYADAAICLRKAVEVEPFAEGPYRSLMQIDLDQGRHANVLLTYQHCRKTLAAGLGCAPSAETEALLRRVPCG